jgi:hydroxymethylpyrimidine/phosphomethylpyrimidine kinase
MRTVLTIAGSDSGGGAGIQADLKTFAAHGVFGTSAVTAVTAQNTLGVVAWQALPADLVSAQIEAVAGDLRPDAVKIGMLGNAAIVEAVAAAVADPDMELPRIVVDPVMLAKDGSRLLEDDAVELMRAELLGRAHVITPNLHEAEILAGGSIRSVEDMRSAARRLLGLGPQVVVIKGGHLDGPESIDVVCTRAGETELRGPRIETRHLHGTGCTFSSAIAANLALGLTDIEALQQARAYLDGAIRHAPGLGAGHGPLEHFWRIRIASE